MEGALIGMYRARYRASIWPARHPFIATFSWWTSPPSPYCLFFEIVRKAAEFIGNIGGTEGQIAQTIGGVAQED